MDLLLCLRDIKVSTDSLLCNKCFTYILSLISTIIFKGKINLILQMRKNWGTEKLGHESKVTRKW